MLLAPLAPCAMLTLAGEAARLKSGVAAAAGVMTKLLEKLGLWPPPVTYSTTLPTFVAGGVQVKFQDVVSPVEKAN